VATQLRSLLAETAPTLAPATTSRLHCKMPRTLAAKSIPQHQNGGRIYYGRSCCPQSGPVESRASNRATRRSHAGKREHSRDRRCNPCCSSCAAGRVATHIRAAFRFPECSRAFYTCCKGRDSGHPLRQVKSATEQTDTDRWDIRTYRNSHL